MIRLMKVTVFCYYCSDISENDMSSTKEMKEDGPLYFNEETKSQSQNYTCSSCNRSINVLIEVK